MNGTLHVFLRARVVTLSGGNRYTTALTKESGWGAEVPFVYILRCKQKFVRKSGAPPPLAARFCQFYFVCFDRDRRVQDGGVRGAQTGRLSSDFCLLLLIFLVFVQWTGQENQI